VELPPAPPAIIAAPVSFGSLAVRVGSRTTSIELQINGKIRSRRPVRPGPRRVSLRLPVGRLKLRVRARGPGGAKWSRARSLTVLPRSSKRLGRLPGFVDRRLQSDLNRLVSNMPAVSGVYVQHLRTNCGAAVNAGAQFPGASTLKAAILLEAVRRHEGRPESSLAAWIDDMVIGSDDRSANFVLAEIGGGSPSLGGARVTETLHRLGLRNSLVRRGYLLDSGRTISLRATSRPALYTNFIITAFELSSLMVALHRGALGKGGVRTKLRLAPTAVRREILDRLLRTNDSTKLEAALPPGTLIANKTGYTEQVKHDSGIVYLQGGPVVITAMTWSRGGVSDARGNRFITDVARASVQRLRGGGACR